MTLGRARPAFVIPFVYLFLLIAVALSFVTVAGPSQAGALFAPVAPLALAIAIAARLVMMERKSWVWLALMPCAPIAAVVLYEVTRRCYGSMF